MKTTQTDFLIIGAGILGLTFAYKLKQTNPDAQITLLEKEASVGQHASGRNSGVLHSGIYYKENTLKAKLCVQGARLMREFCEQHDLEWKKIGKVITPTEPEHDPSVDVLLKRGLANGVQAEIIDATTLASLEPEARTASGRALYLPNTCVINSKQVLAKLVELLGLSGVEIVYQCKISQIDAEKNIVSSNLGAFCYQQLINTAGTFADQVATMAGIKHHYQMMPFRGVYSKIVGDIAKRIHHLIYPVPNLDMPFLGVHTTTTPDGSVYLGPTAMPSFGRENYRGVNNFDFADAVSTLGKTARMYWHNTQGMRNHVHFESQTLLFKKHLLKRAQKLVPNLQLDNIQSCDKRGIRAQLFDTQKQQLEMDFIVQQEGNQLHILNAISPAFTSSLGIVGSLVQNLVEPTSSDCEVELP